MRKFLAIASILLAFVLVGAGCAQLGQEKGSKQGSIKIGINATQSGKRAFGGTKYAHGAMLAARMVNENGGIEGKKVKIVNKDARGDAKTAVSNVKRMINIENINALLSHSTPDTKPITSILKSNNKLLFYFGSISSLVTDQKYFFQDSARGEAYGRRLADLAKHKDFNTVSFIGSQSTACNKIAKHFRKAAKKKDISIKHTVKFQTHLEDLKTPILKAKPEAVDAVATCVFRKENIFMKRFKELGFIDVPTIQIGAQVITRNEPITKGLFDENGTYNVFYGIPDKGLTKKQRKFVKNYKEEFNEDPTGESSYAYDEVMLFAKAARQCGGSLENKDCVAEYLQGKEYKGVGGKLRLNKKGASYRELILTQFRDGKWVRLKE